MFVDHCARLSGGELALERLIGGFDGVRAHVVLGESGPLEARLRGAGASVEVLALDPGMANTHRDEVGLRSLGLARVLATFRATWMLRSRIRRLRPDVVHTNSLKAAIYGGVAGRLAGYPVVWHVRDRIADDYLPGPVAGMVRLLARVLPDVIICNSAETESTLGTGWNAQVVPRAVVYDSVPPAGRSVTDDRGEFRVAIVGRLAPWKGQDVFLRAFALAYPDGGVEGRIIGSALFGEDEWVRELEDLAASLDIAERVEFTGFVEDVPGVLRDVDVLVHASVIPEPFGQVVVEGMAAGLPVVASAAGGPLEVITGGVDGLLVPPGDVERLAEALVRLRDDQDLRNRLGSSARLRAADFSAEKVAAKVKAVYEQILR